jgi:YbbR domain-containing protein
VLERLRNNWGLKLLSLALAVAAWSYLRFAPNPVVAAHFVQQVSVPIIAIGLRSDSVARYTDKQAVVGIDVSRNAPAIKPDDVRAILDLQGRPVGVHNVPVQVIAPKLVIRSLSPASVTLSVEKIEARSLPVTVHYLGDAKKVVVNQITVEPAQVVVRAPTSDLERVTGARVDIALPSGPTNLDSMLRPVAVDERGAELSGVAVAPNLVRVRASFGSGKAK